MPYSMIDVIETFKDFENRIIRIFDEVLLQIKNNNKLINVSKILIREEVRHLEYYDKLIVDLKAAGDCSLGNDLYDKISTLLLDFNKDVKSPNIKTVRELLEYALSIEKLNLDLLKHIQRSFMGRRYNENKINFDVLQLIINEESSHVTNILTFLRV